MANTDVGNNQMDDFGLTDVRLRPIHQSLSRHRYPLPNFGKFGVCRVAVWVRMTLSAPPALSLQTFRKILSSVTRPYLHVFVRGFKVTKNVLFRFGFSSRKKNFLMRF